MRLPSIVGAALFCTSVAQAADYPTMAPLDQYMMDRAAEIALAKSAAPPSIADKATVLVLTRHGYETAVKGSNGFVCAVERAWMSQYDFPQFWNPHMRGPLCYNPPAVRSILPYTIKRTELVLAGRSKPEMIAAIKDAITKSCVAASGSGRDDLYDVQAGVSERRGAQLGAASHVLFSARARLNMGRRSAWRAADAEPAVPGFAGSFERDHGPSDALVRRDIRAQNPVS